MVKVTEICVRPQLGAVRRTIFIELVTFILKLLYVVYMYVVCLQCEVPNFGALLHVLNGADGVHASVTDFRAANSTKKEGKKVSRFLQLPRSPTTNLPLRHVANRPAARRRLSELA